MEIMALGVWKTAFLDALYGGVQAPSISQIHNLNSN